MLGKGVSIRHSAQPWSTARVHAIQVQPRVHTTPCKPALNGGSKARPGPQTSTPPQSQCARLFQVQALHVPHTLCCVCPGPRLQPAHATHSPQGCSRAPAAQGVHTKVVLCAGPGVQSQFVGLLDPEGQWTFTSFPAHKQGIQSCLKVFQRKSTQGVVPILNHSSFAIHDLFFV